MYNWAQVHFADLVQKHGKLKVWFGKTTSETRVIAVGGEDCFLPGLSTLILRSLN